MAFLGEVSMNMKSTLVVVMFLAGTLFSPTMSPAKAQLNILLGSSNSDIKQMLNGRG